MNRLRQNRFARLFILLVVSAAVVLLLGIAVLTLPTATAASSAARPQLIITTTPSMTPTVTKTVTLTATVTMTMTVTPTTTTTLTPTVTITPTFVLSAAAYLPAVVIPQLTPTFTPSPTSPVGCLPNPPLGPSNSTVDAAVFERINQQRHNNGLPSYGDHTRLVQAARRHARDMADNDALSHTGSDGSTVPQRISEACYNAQFTSEIIGWGFPTVDDMMAWWLGSSTHRGAILHLSLQEMGVAYVRQAGSAFTHYWTVVVARPTSADNLDGMLFVCTETIAEPGRGMSVQWVQEWPCEK